VRKPVSLERPMLESIMETFRECPKNRLAGAAESNGASRVAKTSAAGRHYIDANGLQAGRTDPEHGRHVT